MDTSSQPPPDSSTVRWNGSPQAGQPPLYVGADGVQRRVEGLGVPADETAIGAEAGTRVQQVMADRARALQRALREQHPREARRGETLLRRRTAQVGQPEGCSGPLLCGPAGSGLAKVLDLAVISQGM
ncbi:hypothetical protein [Streptomyces clavuligerus]|uniref:hypothetical protein n=1 Tax=Streptomyces clavuligerus TaxID=1901 RepID=UPI00017FF32A|nr:hypothetical protein [Streptomyces clavuligerus]EDY47334.1 hypothetical protein SSCG_00363 [Streptomyces clavuligerus]MBY6306583.1 hypothetical protein [Streptomyces clavuligerus]QPJ97153.1 hypothetical protein GE265_29020 [Streptomyces clavuligerus]WDN57516.1 hypothetical protein LL058_37790 [Streptomyces clavuligerus]